MKLFACLNAVFARVELEFTVRHEKALQSEKRGLMKTNARSYFFISPFNWNTKSLPTSTISHSAISPPTPALNLCPFADSGISSGQHKALPDICYKGSITNNNVLKKKNEHPSFI